METYDDLYTKFLNHNKTLKIIRLKKLFLKLVTFTCNSNKLSFIQYVQDSKKNQFPITRLSA